ncbi:MAG: LLM class flavin-dependent oxidoreductase, partial [Pseudomonadota bacterium]
MDEFGVHVPQIGELASRENLVAFAAAADSLKCHAIWVSDHIAWPETVRSKYPYTDDGAFPRPFNSPWLDPLGLLHFLAATTEHVKLGTSVLILGYRPPIQTAKLIATLDHLSNGRVILGAGVGWMKEEFDALGVPFDKRGRRADECLEIFRTLFEQPLPAFDGEFTSFPPVGFSPQPG